MNNKENNIWSKASVIGSLWASNEIIIGSFLHNMHIPFAGSILAMIGISLLTAFSLKWKIKGLIIRAGLICALMKSISPSGLILGPMIGIFTEAVIIEFFVFILGFSKIAYIIGGAIAVASALVQKIINLLILYGFQLVDILSDLYTYAVKKLSFPSHNPILALLILICIYFLIGITGAILGFIINKKDSKNASSIQVDFKNDTILHQFENIKYHKTWIIPSIIFSLVLGLLIIQYAPFYFSSIIIILYIALLSYLYSRALKKLFKIGIWIQFIILIAATSLLSANFQVFSISSYFSGLKLCLRAAFIISTFSALSVELRNPIIKAIFIRYGAGQLYQGLHISFLALPVIIDAISTSNKKIFNPFRLLQNSINYSVGLLKEYDNHFKHSQKIFIITGLHKEGKTTFVRNIIQILRNKSIEIKGFLAPGIIENNIRTHFFLQEVNSTTRTELGGIYLKENWLHLGRFYFNPKTIKKGNELLEEALLSNPELIIVDELGPFELQGELWDTQIKKLTSNSKSTIILVVREKCVNDIVARYNLSDVTVFNIKKISPKKTANKIFSFLEQKKTT